jgi:hypothetical protein
LPQLSASYGIEYYQPSQNTNAHDANHIHNENRIGNCYIGILTSQEENPLMAGNSGYSAGTNPTTTVYDQNLKICDNNLSGNYYAIVGSGQIVEQGDYNGSPKIAAANNFGTSTHSGSGYDIVWDVTGKITYDAPNPSTYPELNPQGSGFLTGFILNGGTAVGYNIGNFVLHQLGTSDVLCDAGSQEFRDTEHQLVVGQSAVLYPNPGTDVCHILLPQTNPEATLTLTDLTGRILQTVQVQNASIDLHTKALQAGVYIVHIRYADGSQAELRWIKGN